MSACTKSVRGIKRSGLKHQLTGRCIGSVHTRDTVAAHHCAHYALIVLLGITLTACQRKETSVPPAPIPTNIVAEVEGSLISEEKFAAELQRRFPNASSGSLSPSQKESVLENLIRLEAIYAQARKAGFDQTPEMQARIKALVVSQFQEQQFAPPDLTISESEIEAAYQMQEQRFARPAAARGAMIFISCLSAATAEKRAEILERAQAIANEAKAASSPESFARVVAQHSEHQASRYRGGDTGWHSADADGLDASVLDALLTLREPGTFAPLVETPRGFYVVVLRERREPGQQPLDEVRELLRHELARQKMQDAERDFYERMKAGLDIRIHRDRLESIQLPSRETSPPTLPGADSAQAQSESKR